MTTPTAFQLLRQRVGLSRREAADLLGVRPDTVRAWDTGRRAVPADAMTALRELHADQQAEIRDLMDDWLSEPNPYPLIYSGRVAHELGLPCVGAYAAVLGEVIARCGDAVEIVAEEEG